MRLENITRLINDGTHSTPHYTETGIPFLSVRDISSGTLDFSNTKYISVEEHAILSKRTKPEMNDILLSKVGTTGIPVKVDTDKEFSIFVSLALLKFTSSINVDFMVHLIKSPVIFKQSKLGTRGVGNKNLVLQTIKNFLFPLPPLSEQQRIVEAIESALEKVDEYAESYNRLEQLDKEFPDKLKKSILQYAMQGKLVEQDPNDESVEVLLEKIRVEKQKLFEEGKIKKKDLEISIVSQGDDNSYYGNIPENWLLSTLDSVSNLYTGNSINATEKKKYFSGVDGFNYIATKDVNFDSTINYDNGIRIPDRYLSKFKISYSNSVLLCLEGGSAGRKIGLLEQDVCFGNKLCSLSFYYGENKWLYYFLQSPQFLSDFQESKSGIIGGVSKNNLGNILIPVLPRNEQMRITQEIDLLFQKVSQL